MTSDVLIFLMLALTGVEANNIDTDDSIPGSTQRTFLGSASVVVNNDGTCGAHCKYSNSYCYPEGERCLYGCEMGWTGDDCSHPCNMHRCVDCYLDTCTICSEGYYGDKCQHSCNTNCVLERCDRNGNCLYGCEKGWMGNKCTDKDCPFANCELCALNYDDELYCLRCKPGWYFNSFICEVCSSGCKVQEGALTQCNSSTGECLNGCVDKWYGFRCNDQCTISNCRTCVKKWAANILTCSECEEGYFSAQDERSCITCTGHCLNGPTRCDVVTGYCIDGCQPGYFGGRCDQICDIDHCQECESLASSLDVSCASCDTGYYWNPTGLCVPCSTNCREGLLQCDSKTGECLTGCVGGYYGPKCNFVCSAHCSTPNCSMNGNCLGDCVIGYFGDRCDRNCPENCQASCDGFIDGVCSECEAGFYGPTCENKCSENCRRSDQNNYIYCNKSTGDCSNGCPGGRWGPSCNKFCSENCYAQICSQSTGACRVCTQWWYGESCEKKCNANCFYSSAADDRACHITSGECINGCKPGYYGLFCSEPCEGMCENSKCEQENGTCEGCSNGYHGTYCGLECPTNCKHSTCSREMGKCTHGCDDGFHGENCSLKCNPYCKTSCSQLTGDCARGCVAGWYGERCSNPCAPGQYGEECLEICGTCRGNSPCDRFDGSCISGCDIGWTGTLCLERNQVDHFPETAEAQTVVDNKSIVIGGSISGVIVLLAIISSIIFLVFKRKQRKKQRKPEAVANDFQLQEMSGSPNLSAHHHFVKSRSLALTKDSVHIEEHIIMEGHFSDFHRGKFNDGKQSHVVTVKCCHEMTPDRYIKRENEILKYIGQHSNIANFLGTFEDNEHVFIVLEYCDEGDLLTYLRWSQNQLFNITLLQSSIAMAMAYLERKQIILRNLGASNVHLDKNFKPKIVNFEWAVHEDREDSVLRGDRQSNRLPLSLFPWLAIESLKYHKFSNKSDVWSFGTFLWELETTGGEPYSEIDNSEIVNRLDGGYRLPLPTDSSEFISRMMQSCWQDDPADRPSFSELSSSFTKHLDNRQTFKVHVPVEMSTTV